MVKDYHEPEDLLSDESFLSWYLQPEQNPDSEWNKWMEEEPGRKQLVQQAITLLETTVIGEKRLPAGQLQQAEAAMLQKIEALEWQPAAGRTEAEAGARVVTLPARGGPLSGHRNWRWIAAACILVVLSAAMVITRMHSSGEEMLVTRYGQLMVQRLPDGSEVTVNANSRLRYANAWKENADREVWIEGEAFFHVRKTVAGSRFVVHTDRFDVVVTGTQFNVVNRPGKANVMLQEGSVTLRPKEGEEMKMFPGDFVQWAPQGLDKREVQSDSVLAWKERKLFFDKTPLKEVVAIIEDQYGVKVSLSDQSIADSTITGIMPNNNLDVLLQALEATSDFNVVNSNGNILIKAPTH
jgi:transmembrane sensor